jgi:hypothetical protein
MLGNAAALNEGSSTFAENNDSDQTQSHGALERNNLPIENKKKPSRQNSSLSRFGRSDYHFLQPWWMEIIASVLVLLAIMAIVLVLALYQNQPLPNWPFGISVNSLVSIFVVILKGGMLLILSEGFQEHYSTF